jgi:hypothetical protein
MGLKVAVLSPLLVVLVMALVIAVAPGATTDCIEGVTTRCQELHGDPTTTPLAMAARWMVTEGNKLHGGGRAQQWFDLLVYAVVGPFLMYAGTVLLAWKRSTGSAPTS